MQANAVHKTMKVNTAAMGLPQIRCMNKEATRLSATRCGDAEATACDGCPPLSRLFQQYIDGGGELLVCPICFNARQLDEAGLVKNARLAGASPLWDWIGEGATVFSY